MRIALVHDQLQEFGGAERVLIALHEIFPNAPVYTAFLNQTTAKKNIRDFSRWKIITSWAAKIPFIGKLYSPLRFLAPAIWESFDFSEFDVVVSSSGWYMCKGIKIRSTGSGSSAHPLHISYIHHPPRYLYGYETAVEWQKYWPVKIYATVVNYFLRRWDYLSSQRPDVLIANSEETKKRIKKLYNRDSTVIYPPVSIPSKASIKYQVSSIGYYVTVSRLGKAKHIDLLIQSANINKFNLKIVGKGRDLKFLKSIAGDTVEFVSDADDQKRDELIAHAKAFLFASVDEEFGIAPVEAMGFGTPVIAYDSGGLKETVTQEANGFLFKELNPQSLYEEIKKLESLSEEKYLEMRRSARKESEKYSFDRFKKEILSLIPRG